MSESYEQAVNELEDRVIKAIVRAEDNGLKTADIVAELRRIADQTEAESGTT